MKKTVILHRKGSALYPVYKDEEALKEFKPNQHIKAVLSSTGIPCSYRQLKMYKAMSKRV